MSELLILIPRARSNNISTLTLCHIVKNAGEGWELHKALNKDAETMFDTLPSTQLNNLQGRKSLDQSPQREIVTQYVLAYI